jgi:hypothetical protein
MLGLLIRKRLDPDIVSWVADKKQAGENLDGSRNTDQDMDESEGGGPKLTAEGWEALWDWAAPEANAIVRDVFPELTEDAMDTSEGRGARKAREKEPEEPLLPMEDIMRFTSAGTLPKVRPNA